MADGMSPQIMEDGGWKMEDGRSPQRMEDGGWKMEDGRSPLFAGLPDEFYLYFVHSYHAACEEKYAIGKTYYGYEFVSAVQNGNVYGIQPHPEKSHENGLKIIENFTKL
jgi:glutamine amidotransferase